MLKKGFLLLTLVLSIISCKNKESEPTEISQEEITFTQDGKLQIINRFDITGEEDAIYYTLLCAEHSQLDKEKTLINVKGLYNNNLIDQLKKYFNSDKMNVKGSKYLSIADSLAAISKPVIYQKRFSRIFDYKDHN